MRIHDGTINFSNDNEAYVLARYEGMPVDQFPLVRLMESVLEAPTPPVVVVGSVAAYDGLRHILYLWRSGNYELRRKVILEAADTILDLPGHVESL